MNNSLELKINPPLQMLISVALMYGIAHTLPLSAMLQEHKWSLVGICLVIGLLFNITGGVSFRSEQTTGNPSKPETTSSLVTSGIYRFTRNPMYVGLLFLLLAWGIYLGSFFSMLVIPLFQQYMTRFQIIPEERALETLFTDQFPHYRSQVRRWL